MQNPIFLIIGLVSLSLVSSIYFISSYQGAVLASNNNNNSLTTFQDSVNTNSQINSISEFNSTSQSKSSNGSLLDVNNNNSKGSISAEEYDKLKNCSEDTDKKPTSIEYLTYFNCGHILPNSSNTKDNQTVREFTLFIEENSSVPIASNGLVFSPSWTFNGTIPGPTMRVTEGDL